MSNMWNKVKGGLNVKKLIPNFHLGRNKDGRQDEDDYDSSSDALAAQVARESEASSAQSTKDALLNSLPGGFFKVPSTHDAKNGFDAVEYMLQRMPEVLDDKFFESEDKRMQEVLEVVTSKLAKKVNKNYTSFVSGMTQIHDIGRDVQQTAVLCSSGRHFLHELDTHLVEQSKKIVSRFGRQKQLRQVIDTVQALRTVTDMERQVWEAAEESNFAGAVEKLTLLLSMNIRSKYDSENRVFVPQQFACLRSVTTNAKTGFAVIEKKMEDSLRQLCRDFEGTQFASVLQGFFALCKPEMVSHWIQQYSTQHAERTVRDFVYAVSMHNPLMQQQIMGGNRSSEVDLKAYPLSELCAYLDESSSWTCFVTICSALVDLLNNVLCFIDWCIQEKQTPTVVVYVNASSESEYGPESPSAARSRALQIAKMEWFDDLIESLLAYRKSLVEVMFRDVAVFLSSIRYAHMKSERYLEIYQYARGFRHVAIGGFLASFDPFVPAENDATFHAAVTNFSKVLYDQTKLVVAQQYREQMEVLRMMLETEVWMRIQVSQPSSTDGSDLSFAELREFRQTKTWSRLQSIYRRIMEACSAMTKRTQEKSAAAIAAANASTSTVAPSSTISAVSAHSSSETGYLPNPFKEQIQIINDERKRRAANRKDRDPDRPIASDHDDTADEEAPWVSSLEPLFADPTCIVSSSSMHILRTYGRWLHILNVLDEGHRSEMALNMVSMFQFYFYAIFVHFARPPSAFMQAHESSSASSSMASFFSRDKDKDKDVGSMNSEGGLSGSAPAGSAYSQQGMYQGQYFPEQDLSLPSAVWSYFAQLKNSVIASSGIALPAMSTMTDIEKPFDLFGVHGRAVAMETTCFIFQVLKLLRSYLEVDASSKQYLSSFFQASWDALRDARVTLYSRLSLRLLPYSQFTSWVQAGKFEIKEMTGDHSEYVVQIRKEFLTIKEAMEALHLEHLGHHIVRILWESMIRKTMEAMLRGYAQVKKCTTPGRAQMAIDLKTLQSSLEKLTGLRPLPAANVVDQYIKAYYFPGEEDFLMFFKRTSDVYTAAQITNLVSLTAVGQQFKGKQKKDFSVLLENIERDYWISEGRRPDPSSAEDTCSKAFDRGLWETVRDML